MNTALPSGQCNLEFNQTVTRWDEAIPLGNGRMGALIWGPSNALRFSLDRNELWDLTPFPGVKSPEFTYQTMAALASKGRQEEIRRIFSTPYSNVTPCKLPAGKLILDLKETGIVRSTLELAGALAVIRVNEIRLECFLHASRPLGLIRVNRPASDLSLTIENPEYGMIRPDEEQNPEQAAVPGDSLKSLHYPPPEKHTDGRHRWFIQQIGGELSYGIFLSVEEKNGTTLIAFETALPTDSDNWRDDTFEALDGALASGFDVLLDEHREWWRHFWEKSGVSLPDPLFEKNWYLTNYLLGSCSRRGGFPMPLQGVWTADDGCLPPWKGDYHQDLNLQMSYYSYAKANHLEEGECLLDYLWNLNGKAREFAADFFNAEGLCLPSVMAIDGQPLGGWAMYSLIPGSQMWICQAFERHYRFTGDRTFLAERAYPYLKETAKFILHLLKEEDGEYFLPISSSPEIHDDTIKAFLTPNSNFDLALLRYLFTELVSLSRELDPENTEETSKWQAVLGRLPEFSVNSRHVLMLSPTESLEESHRHHSHLMAIHPLRLIRYETEEEKEIIDASLSNLEELGKGAWTGYSCTWAAELYAVQKNGNAAAYQLGIFWKYFCSQNGFHLNYDYKKCGITASHDRPFTLEGNFCAADALQEMLLQSEDGILDLFPAIPDEWYSEPVSFTNFRAEKGLLISASLDSGTLTELRIAAPGTVSDTRLKLSPCTWELAQKYKWPVAAGCYVLALNKPLSVFTLS